MHDSDHASCSRIGWIKMICSWCVNKHYISKGPEVHIMLLGRDAPNPWGICNSGRANKLEISRVNLEVLERVTRSDE